MEHFVVVCFFVVMLGFFSRDATGEKPMMFPLGKEDRTQVGQELRIECSSKGASIWFFFPNNTIMTPRSEHEILQTGDYYTFLRRQTVFGDTGWYACAEVGIEIDHDYRNLNHSHQDISWIYIYVLTGKTTKFVDNDKDGVDFPKTMITVTGSRTVIPCRTSNSYDLNVRLRQNSKFVELSEKVRYDSRIGFIMEPGTVVFEEGEAVLECEVDDYGEKDTYVLRRLNTSEPKPTMISPVVDELVLQEGDELRIECHSETKIGFHFPDAMPPSSGFARYSKYEIFSNQNGTSTFLRREAISNDTGWYGCGVEGLANDIPYHSVNYTRREISWVYIYVNSTVPITSGPLILSIFNIQSDVFNSGIIPCRPTSPDVNIILLRSNHEIDEEEAKKVRFDPKLGFILGIKDLEHQKLDYQCSTREILPQVSENYTIGISDLFTLPWGRINNRRSIQTRYRHMIRMTGEDANFRCRGFVLDGIPLNVRWFPTTKNEKRMEISHEPTIKVWLPNTYLYLTLKHSSLRITNLTESDSGDIECLWSNGFSTLRFFRDIQVFDRNGPRYIKLGEQRGERKIVAVKGQAIGWLVDRENFPNSKIEWYDKNGGEINNRTRIAAFELAGNDSDSRLMFSFHNLSLNDSGQYQLRAIIPGQTALIVNVTLNVCESPVASIHEQLDDFYPPSDNLSTSCDASGTPTPNITWSFLRFPKFPSHENSTRVYFKSSPLQMAGNNKTFRSNVRWRIDTPGILSCEACNIANCAHDTKQLYSSATREPYFTITNLNKSEVTLRPDEDGSNGFLLQCYARGWPHPNVTWFKDNVPLEQGRLMEFAYNNSELTVLGVKSGDGGRYLCRAENPLGRNETWIDIKIDGDHEDTECDSMQPFFVITVILLLVLVVGCYLIVYNLRSKASRKTLINAVFKNGAFPRLNTELSVIGRTELVPYNGKWEFPRELLTLDKILGSGAFGIVRKAEAKSICQGEAVSTVAVKLIRENVRQSFMAVLSRELKILVHLGKHPNIVNLLGTCTENVSYGELFVIVEFCRFGNLRDYLRSRRGDFIDEINPPAAEIDSGDGTDFLRTKDNRLGPNKQDTQDCGEDSVDSPSFRSKYQGDYSESNVGPIATHDLVSWSWQVSRGMEFLRQRKVVHGDLAARNVLLADDGVVKISDFGLAEVLYDEAEFRHQVDPLPVKWMAVESIKDRVFSFQSDIWTFGIVMWEFFTLAETPYPGIRSQDLYQKLADGHRMRRPKFASGTVYDTMLQCWEADPSERPSFTELAHVLGGLVNGGSQMNYHVSYAPNTDLNADFLDNVEADYLATPLLSHHSAQDASVDD